MLDIKADGLARSEHYRLLAVSLRTLIPTLKTPESRLELRELADDFERLAEFALLAAEPPPTVDLLAEYRVA
jgi:hypothetical protein